MSNILPYSSYKKHRYANWRSIVLFFLLTLPSVANSQIQNDYDEISVTLNVPRIGSWEMPALIKGQSAYLPVKELLDVLQIKNSASNADSITGFFINPKAAYLIDKAHNKIIYQDTIFSIDPNDFIRSENILYLKTDYFGKIFGLDCSFNFRNLSITLNTKLELPAIREMQLEQMRRNITQLKGDKKADTTIKRRFTLLSLSMADWAIINLQQAEGYKYTKLTANIGGIVAGGEATMYLNYTNTQPFNFKHQYYRWRYVNNENNLFKQITAGNIFVQTTASVYGALNGIQITNAPTTYRRSFGTYRLSNTTEPGWVVELYVNNVLVNYTKADASGFFTFDVPLMYGSTAVKLRFYGPWGEERSREQLISVPFNFLPPHQFEYSLTAGLVDDVQKSKFSRLSFNYGLGSNITIGGGMEYLSTMTSGKSMPFLNTSIRMGGLLISAEHTYGVRSKTLINYRFPFNLQLEINYVKYVPGQTAIRSGQAIANNYIEDKKIVLFMPFRKKDFSGFSRLSITQLTIPKLKYTTAELLLSGMYKNINTNFTTSAVYYNPTHPLLYSNLAITFRPLKGIRITPQVQYEYNHENFSMMKCDVEKNLWNRGFLIFSYEKYAANKSYNISLGVRYNFSFSQTSVTVSRSDMGTSLIQTARGSILYNDKSRRLTLNDQSNVGRGGLVIVPFLDINNNGKRDTGEQIASGLKLRINGGRIEYNKRDTTIIVSGLEAYSNYFIEFDKNSLDNIGWQLRKSSMNIVIEPNYFKLVEVPVTVVGEVTGTVYSENNKVQSGLGRIIVNFYKSDSTLAARTITEADGYFSFMGLVPGNYTARVDKSQLDKLSLSAIPSDLPFTIKKTKEGDLVTGLKFILTANNLKVQ